jgi:hypothetical protein
MFVLIAPASKNASQRPQLRSAMALDLARPGSQTGGMSPIRQNAAADSFDEIATIRIELRHTDPLIWRQVEVPTSIGLVLTIPLTWWRPTP